MSKTLRLNNMEKTAASEYMVFNENGILKLKLPGGSVIKYDNRFPECPQLKEGETYVTVKE
jgi:hypothetical protein